VTTDPEALRAALLTEVRARGGALTEPVADALRTVPRHVFVPEVPVEEAYVDDAIVTKQDPAGLPISSSSQPTIMAIMLDQLAAQPGHRVLEIGAGTGYNAALLAHLVGAHGEVVSVDIDQDVVDRARTALATAGYPDVTVVCADGADGYPARAPYDRIIATVGVWELAPSWLDQLAPAGRIVVPLDLRGAQCSVAFERDGGCWVSRSVEPCGFMRMRGTLAGPEQVYVLDEGTRLVLQVPDDRDLDPHAVAALLAGPAVEVTTGVVASAARIFDGLPLWLGVREPRVCQLSESTSAEPARLPAAVLQVQTMRITAAIVADRGVAVLTRAPGGDLVAAGHGPAGPRLAGELADHIRAWGAAGRPDATGLRIVAHPDRGAPAAAAADATVIQKRHTRLVVTWPSAPPGEPPPG